MKTRYTIAAATGAMLLTAPAQASWWSWTPKPSASSGGSSGNTSTSSGNTSTSSGNTSTSSGSSGSTSSSGGSPTSVPEPGVAGLFGAGALGLWLARRRRKQQ